MSDSVQHISAVIHVHSTLSSGFHTPAAIGRLAAEQGVRAVLFSDKADQRVFFGVKPFEGLARVGIERESVPMSEIGDYLKTIGAAQRESLGVLMIPGFEVAPFYRWEGDPRSGYLALRESGCELLVYGMKSPEDWRGLPLISNPYAAKYSSTSVLQLAFCIILAGIAVAAFFFRKKNCVEIGLSSKQRISYTVCPFRPLSAFLLLASIVLFCAWYPYKRYPYSPYEEPGAAPYQTLIEYVAKHGGVTVWAHPEARSAVRYDIRSLLRGPLARIPLPSVLNGRLIVEAKNEGCVEAMTGARGFTAFGALYEGMHRVGCLGCLWDTELTGYSKTLSNGAPPWAVAERDYHGGNSDTLPLGDSRTVFITGEFSAAGIIEALRAGRMYGIRYDRNQSLLLNDFKAESGGRNAKMGGTVESRGTVRVSGIIDLFPAGGRVRATLVRNGKVIRRFGGKAPVVFNYSFNCPENRRMDYYRVVADNYARALLISNPVFVKRNLDSVNSEPFIPPKERGTFSRNSENFYQ